MVCIHNVFFCILCFYLIFKKNGFVWTLHSWTWLCYVIIEFSYFLEGFFVLLVFEELGLFNEMIQQVQNGY
jgi:hypothetical protein